MRRIEALEAMAKTIIDLSADFRLRNADDYPAWYGHAHEAPTYLDRFVYGIPELHRKAIVGATLITGAGCLATASILGLDAALQARRPRQARGVHRGEGRFLGGGRYAPSLHPSSRAQRLGPLLPAHGAPAHGGDRPGTRLRSAARRALQRDRHRGGARRPGHVARVPQRRRRGEGHLEGLSGRVRRGAVHSASSRSARASTGIPSRRFWPAAISATSASRRTRAARAWW